MGSESQPDRTKPDLTDTSKNNEKPKQSAAITQSKKEELGSYQFSDDWFSHNVPNWIEHLEPFKGKANLSYLEVGVFEGRSFVWMMDNIMTHPSSSFVAIDIFPGSLQERFVANVKQAGRLAQTEVIKGFSAEVLRKMTEQRFDIIYVDGSHTSWDVLTDAVLCWELLKDGGVLIFDDYQWIGSGSIGLLHRSGGVIPQDARKMTPELLPGPAIDAFITTHRYFLEVIHRGYQLMVKKKANPCLNRPYCSPFGDYLYLWSESLLLAPKTKQEYQLNPEESAVIEKILHAAQFGYTELSVPETLKTDKTYLELNQRLDLGFTN